MNVSSTMSMAMPTTSSGVAAPSSSSSMSMGSMGMGGGGRCKISMLWNWYTIDTCFISSTWKNTSTSMFAGSCVGVVFLVVMLEFLRRVGKEYDRYLLRSHQQRNSASISANNSGSDWNRPGSMPPAKDSLVIATTTTVQQNTLSGGRFTPNIWQQAVRALLHMVQFAVAYFIMLLAMYYNGYIIICILIGSYIGAFIFSWEALSLGGPSQEVTACCG